MAYLRTHLPLLHTLTGWYPDSAELQALMNDVDPGSVVQGLGLGGESAACMQVSQLSVRLQLKVWGEGGDREEGALVEALEEADLSTKGSEGADLLLLLERPIMELLAAPSSRVRDAAYTLALRLAVLRPEASPRLAETLREFVLCDLLSTAPAPSPPRPTLIFRHCPPQATTATL